MRWLTGTNPADPLNTGQQGGFSRDSSIGQDDTMNGNLPSALRLISGVYVFCVLALQMTANAQDATASSATAVAEKVPQGIVSAKNSLEKYTQKATGEAALPTGTFNGFADQRLVPDPGAPGSAGYGFSHFALPLDRYTNWYRPRAATLTQYQRCAPDTFRPRGLGHLFNRPCDGFRMEYQPYTLSDGMSTYGPAYISRLPDPRCEHCEKDSRQCRDCQ